MKLVWPTAFILILSFPLYAANHGVVGHTYTIAEQDFLEFITYKIQAMQSNGQWPQLQTQFKQHVKAHFQVKTRTV